MWFEADDKFSEAAIPSQLLANAPIIYPLKTLENQRFSGGIK